MEKENTDNKDNSENSENSENKDNIEIKDDKGELHKEGEIFESETCEISACQPTFQEETLKDKIRWKVQDAKEWYKRFLIKNAMKVIRKCAAPTNYLEHAKQEFKAIGYKPLNEDQEDGPDRWIQENVLDLLTLFSTQGHSGYSASYCVSYFEKLARFKPLSSIKCTDDEWNECNGCGDKEIFQNNRLSSVFKTGKDGTPYYLDAIVWKDQNGFTFTGTVEELSSCQNIRIPFKPKTFYVDVISTEWADKEETEKKEGGGWWTNKIKDRKQLWKVFEYYDKYDENDGK